MSFFDDAYIQFRENFDLFTNPAHDPKEYNLFAGLLNLSKGLSNLENKINLIENRLEKIERNLNNEQK